MRFLILISLFFNFFPGWKSTDYQLDLARIQSPNNGDVLQGRIDIIGTATGIGFQYAEISFRFQKNDSGSWFLISQVGEPKIEGFLTSWDTSTIVDGDYQLKIQAFYEDGHNVESIIDDLRIRNYSAIETIIPPIETPLNQESTKIAAYPAQETLSTRQYATPLPKNELIIEESDIIVYAIRGAVIGVLSLIVLSLWLLIRRRMIG